MSPAMRFGLLVGIVSAASLLWREAPNGATGRQSWQWQILQNRCAVWGYYQKTVDVNKWPWKDTWAKDQENTYQYKCSRTLEKSSSTLMNLSYYSNIDAIEKNLKICLPATRMCKTMDSILKKYVHTDLKSVSRLSAQSINF
jgi:hypothetical protein